MGKGRFSGEDHTTSKATNRILWPSLRLLFLRQSMPTPTLPPEILGFIFKTNFDVRELLSLCLVCQSWYFSALPLLVKELKPRIQLQNYSQETIDQLVLMLTFARRHGLPLGPIADPGCSIEASVVKCTHSVARCALPVLHEQRVRSLARLLRALDIHTLSVDVQTFEIHSWYQRLEEFLPTALGPNPAAITTFRVANLRDHFFFNSLPPRPAPFLPTLLRMFGVFVPTPPPSSPTPVRWLLKTLHPHLTHLHLENCSLALSLALPFSLALRRCPALHTLRLRDTTLKLPPDHFAATLAFLSHLHTLSVRETPVFGSPRRLLAPAVRLLAHPSAPPLTVLELDDMILDDDQLDYAVRKLVIRHADTLTRLTVPGVAPPGGRGSTAEGKAMLACLLATPMPRLMWLDVSRIVCREGGVRGEGGKKGDEGDNGPPWPELRELVAGTCRGAKEQFVRKVVRGCPRLECVRVEGGAGGLKEKGFARVAGWRGGECEPWVREGLDPDMRRSWKWDEEEGLLVKMR